MRRSFQAAVLVIATITAVGLQAVPAFAAHSLDNNKYFLAPGDTSVVVRISGSGFSGTPTVTTNATGVTVNGASLVDATHIDVTFTASSTSQMTDFTHDANISVHQGLIPVGLPGSDDATCTACLHVGPIIDSFTPPGADTNPAGTVQITATGRGFHQSGATLSLFRDNIGWDGTEDLAIPVTTGSFSGCTAGICTSVSGTATVRGYTPGAWNLSVKNNDDNGIGKAVGTFTITGGDATFAVTTPVVPTSLGQGAGIPDPTLIDVNGTNLYRGMLVTFQEPAAGSADTKFVQTGPVQWDASSPNTHVKVPVKVLGDAAVGDRDVYVLNNPTEADPLTADKCAACTAVNAGPSITSSTPSSLGRGASGVTVAVVGTGFSNTPNPPTASFVKNSDNTKVCGSVTGGSPSPGVAFSAPLDFVDATHFTLHVNVDSASALEACDLVIHNADQGGFTKASALTIVAGPSFAASNPIVPSSGPQGRTNLDLVFHGTNFGVGANKPVPADITFSGIGITVNSVTEVQSGLPPAPDPTQLTVNISIDQTAPNTARSVTLINHNDRGQATCASCFGVNLGPSITDITPSQLGQGATSKTLTITGDNFLNNAAPTVSFSGAGVTVDANGVTFVNAQTLTVKVTVAGNATPGNRDVTVTNKDSGSFTKSPGLLVARAPSITGFTPTSLGQGATSRDLIINAVPNSFQQGIQPGDIVFSGTPTITVTSVVGITDTALEVLVDVPSGTAAGNHSIVVTNPDFGAGGCQNQSACFTVNAAPTIASLSTSSAGNGSTLVDFAVTGSNYAPGAAVQLEMAGQAPIPLAITGTTGSTQIKGDLPLSNPYGSTPAVPAAPGTWKVRVTNPDGGSILSTQNFTVTNAAGPPVITSVVPNSVPQGALTTITINGTGFASGSSLSPISGITFGTVTVESPTKITVDVNVDDNAPVQANDVRVTNTDAQTTNCAQCLLVAAKPVIDLLTPPAVNPGSPVKLVITGSGFQSDATVVVTGSGVTPGTPLTTSSNTIEMSLSIDRDQPEGFRTVRVTNPDGGTAVCIGCLRISDMGYWLTATDGGVFSFPGDRFHGSTGDRRLNQPIVGMAPTRSGQGYWFVAADGGIFSFGDAQFYGSTGDRHLNKPIVGMAVTPSGNGYWLVASDGGVFTFGDAQFFGSTGAMKLNKPIVGMAPTPTGLGYWLVASDGGIFTDDTVNNRHFGDAVFRGSEGGHPLNSPIVGMAATSSGNGYWFVAKDGGIFTEGDAPFFGSEGGTTLAAPIVGMARTISGRGYWLVGSDGNVFAHGDAILRGSMFGKPLNKPVVGMAPST
jgi:hypothetical protein